MAYENKIQRVETIASDLDSDRLPLTAALALYEEGIELLREAAAQLSAMERKAQELIARADGVFELVDLDQAKSGR